MALASTFTNSSLSRDNRVGMNDVHVLEALQGSNLSELLCSMTLFRVCMKKQLLIPYLIEMEHPQHGQRSIA